MQAGNEGRQVFVSIIMNVLVLKNWLSLMPVTMWLAPEPKFTMLLTIEYGILSG